MEASSSGKIYAKTTAAPCVHAHSILCTGSPRRCPSPHHRGTSDIKSLSLRTACPPSLVCISNHFPGWPHKKNVSNVQATRFSCLGVPDIITATTNSGLHPNPFLPLAQGLKAEGCRALWCQCGPRAPAQAPTLGTALSGLRSGSTGAFLFPGCHEGSKGKILPSKLGGNWAPSPEGAPHSLPAKYAPAFYRLLPGYRKQAGQTEGRGERGEGDLLLLLGVKAWMLGADGHRSGSPRPTSPPQASLCPLVLPPTAGSIKGHMWAHPLPSLLPGLQTRVAPIAVVPPAPSTHSPVTPEGLQEGSDLCCSLHTSPQALQSILRTDVGAAQGFLLEIRGLWTDPQGLAQASCPG